tara:strand:- start:275 stop:1462 length:1188 start_codon:yes stop_codon:yes gene_type:complete
MTTFYSTKVHKEVVIPQNKVCGYRFKNELVKDGYSNAVRSGKDNGVVPQKFSRFSTALETSNAGSVCAGNTNWLNNKIEFNKVKIGTQFEFKRPAFVRGTVAVNKGNVEMPAQIRGGIGNRSIVRNNFLAAPIKGREMIDFEKLQAQDISEGGIKVQFGDKTLEQLFKIQVEDITDVEWLDEYERRKALGETEDQLRNMPPLGRPQRQVSKMKNFGEQGNSVNDKVEMLTAAVLQGHTETKEQMAQIMVSAAGILGSEENLRRLTQANFNSLRQIIGRMNVPKNYRAAGFTHRLFSLEQYRDEQGLVNLFLLSNLPMDRSLNTPIATYNARGDIRGRPTLIQIVNSMQAAGGNPGKFLDIQLRGIIPRSSAIDLVNDGLDGGMLNNVVAPPGGWV